VPDDGGARAGVRAGDSVGGGVFGWRWKPMAALTRPATMASDKRWRLLLRSGAYVRSAVDRAACGSERTKLLLCSRTLGLALRAGAGFKLLKPEGEGARPPRNGRTGLSIGKADGARKRVRGNERSAAASPPLVVW
jgi:hypothetical protein